MNFIIIVSISETSSAIKELKRIEQPCGQAIIEKFYEKGISLTKKEMKPFEERLRRSEKLPLRDIVIQPVIR